MSFPASRLSPFRSLAVWPPEHDPTSPTATPDYDEWGPDDYWKAADWLQWHRALKDAYGLDEANWRFITAWDEQTSLANPIDARSFNSEFIAYAKANGFYEALFSGTGALARPVAAAAGAVRAGAQAVEDVTSAVTTVSSLSRFILPAVALYLGYLYLQTLKPARR